MRSINPAAPRRPLLLSPRLAELWQADWIAMPLQHPARMSDARESSLDDPLRPERLRTLQRGPAQ